MSNKEEYVDGAFGSGVKEVSSIAARCDNGYAPSLITSTSGMDSFQSHALLNDPTLIEDYSDIINNRPTGGSKLTSGNEDSESMGGSVVVTPTSNKSSPFNSKLNVLSNPAEKSHSALRNTDDDKDVEEENVEKHTHSDSRRDQRHSKENSSELPDSYDYSDSEFEDNLERRLQEIETDSVDSADKDEVHFTVSNTMNRELSDVDDFSDGLKYAISEDDDEEENYSDDNDFDRKFEDAEFEGEKDDLEEENDDYQPLSPPRELDPDKLYALYAFNGHDSSHCQLGQDEPCILLNDQDAYWWLVKRITDGKIGFAPAEILETFPERLARLNCWKNENMSSQSVASSDSKDDSINSDSKNESDAGSIIPTPALNGYGKGNKSVSFNDVVGYADRFIDDAVEDTSLDSNNDGGDDDGKSYDNDVDNDNETKVRHRDEYSEAKLNFGKFQDDDMSDVVSDVSFSTSLNTPLNVKKIRRPDIKNESALKPSSSNGGEDGHNANRDVGKEKSEPVDSDYDADLRKVFEAPRMPFANGIAKSDSQNSLSTIGEFSPSSSEWTNESPSTPIVEESSSIPSSRAIKDISQYIHAKSKIEESTNMESTQKQSQPSLEPTEGMENQTDVEQPEGELEKRHSTHEEEKQSSLSLHSSSEEDFYMDEQRAISSASINSSLSGSRALSNTNMSDPASKPHSLVQHLYAPVFDRMDVLMKQLDEIIRK
ncbi:protein phosphatase regulator BUD14 [Saccharomyces paradoxus]|uniref:Protein phosphatase regulator BUD14 n=1 Tax=Saccharomyces paradoxus TaxID=27291 RepID=A0A8B8ULG2_SACPA|nr:Bud14 [Saccharomyces paradoxus]QHS71444.1 Bud14 [Saccharomyces paradoxus]